MKTTFLLLRIQTSKRIVAIFLLFAVLSMWAAADAYAQNKIKYTYDSAGNRLTRQKEIVIQTRGALSDDEGECFTRIHIQSDLHFANYRNFSRKSF